jgi:hypothetical protein
LSANELRRLIIGHQISQAISVATELGIPDLLADGARTSDELAEATDTHAPSLYRLLRALATVDVLHEEDGRRFTLGPIGTPLRTNVNNSLAGWARFGGRQYYRASWSALEHSIRTGENAFRHIHGTDVWSYRAERPEESAIFDGAMQSLTRGVNDALADAYDFGRFSTVVDVGGGNGTLLAGLLARHPALEGVLFDQEHVVALSDEVLEGAAGRCRVVAGSFFEAVPEGGDAYVLKSIIHDWEDEEAVAILRVVRRTGGIVLLVERQLGGPNEDAGAKFSDLNMLVMPGGMERTTEEYAALFEAAGYRFAGETPLGIGWAVYEGAPA